MKLPLILSAVGLMGSAALALSAPFASNHIILNTSEGPSLAPIAHLQNVDWFGLFSDDDDDDEEKGDDDVGKNHAQKCEDDQKVDDCQQDLNSKKLPLAPMTVPGNGLFVPGVAPVATLN
jgi:hypothetical protein|tara:strand:- start:3677 stop:4036 length:360 start_codon:yes stop_codon:yes gene_type:complete